MRRCGDSATIRLLLLLAAIAPAAGSASDWAAAYQDAAGILRKGNTAAAERAFQALWKENPTDFALANAIGAALNSAGKQDEAAAWFHRSLRLNPAFAPAYNNLGLNYASRGMPAQATGPLRKACELDPQNVRAFYNLGLVLIQLRRYGDAAAAFRRAHALSPQLPDPVIRLAYAEFRAGRAASGDTALAALLKLPGDRQVHLVSALKTLNAVGRHEAALRLARENGTNAPEVRIQQAEALLSLRKYDESAALLENHLPPDAFAEGYVVLGSAQALRGELARAVSSLQSAVRLAPSDPDAYCRLGLVFLAGYRDSEAREVMEQGLRNVPDSPRLLDGLGTVLEVMGKRQEAIQAFERSTQVNPGRAEAWGYLGDLYSQLGQADKAVAAYARTLRLGAPAECYANYTDYLIGLQRMDEAKKVVVDGLARYPRRAELHYELAKLYQQRGELPAAEKALRRALALHADDGSVHYLLARVLQGLGRTDEASAEFKLTREAKSEERHRKVLRTRLIPAVEAAPDASPGPQ